MGSSVRKTAWLLTCALVLAATAALAGGAAAAECNPLATRTCLAPFPSNVWTKVDPSSPTGLRADVSDDLVRPEVLAKLPTQDGISPTGVFGDATGFSAGVGAVFEFDRAPLASSLPADGGQAVVAFDLDAGQRVPVEALISDDSTNPLLVSATTHVVQVFPRVRWAFGHRILVAVTKSLVVPGGNDPDFEALAAGGTKHSARAQDYVDEVRQALGAAGLNPASVRTATLFTVRPRSDSVGRMQSLIDRTTARPHEVRKLAISYDLLNFSIGGVVTGEVRLDNYRRRAGTADVDFSGATRRDQWVPFRLTLPRASQKAAAPVVIYAHGLGGFKEMDLLVTGSNAARGYATLSIDWPNHGVRSLADGGNILLSLTPSKLPQHAGMLNQATLDLAGLHKALTTSLAGIDYFKPASLFNPLGWGGNGRPDIDPSRVVIEGTSLGGVLGSNFAALTPKLRGIAFSVSGVGISHILSKTLLWTLGFGFVMPHEATGTEHAMLLAALQQVIDPADAVNSFDFVRHPRSGQSQKPLLLMLGKGDSIVPGSTSLAMASLAEIPLVGEQLFAMPGLARSSSFAADGSGVRQYPPLTGPIDVPLLSAASAHASFFWPSAVAEKERFLDRVGR